jgi:Domain of unknown function (DUF5916)/Carbohydrate family 9 binding domain-like
LLLFCLPTIIFAQTIDGSKFQAEYQLKISQTKGAIKIDGLLDEATWQQANEAKDFWQKFPADNIKEKSKTIVKSSYDDKYLYFAAICYDTSTYVIQTLKRDVDYFSSDGLGIFIDPMNQKSNGFLFGISPLNVQSEDLIAANSFGEPTFSWDNKWFSATKTYPDHWTVEIAIPFKTLRFDPKNTFWGINFVRNDMKNYHYNTWTKVPLQFFGIDFGYTGALVWDKPPQKQNFNASIIPYLTGSISANNELKEKNISKLNGGLDAKIALSSAMNLDITVNPDFSQIEVDRQVTNLTRFNIFFPERRTFFLENDDIFSSYGSPPFRPFYSRTIGLDKNGQSIPILGGLRLTGNLNKGLRVGLMNMQTQKVDAALAKERRSIESPAQNFTAFTFSQRILARSTIKGYFLNKQSNLSNAEKIKNPLDQYGRNQGLELSYSDLAGKLMLWAGYHLSQKPNITKENHFKQFGINFTERNFSFFVDYADFKKDYYADMGFINRIETQAIKGSQYSDGDTTIRGGFKQVFSEIEYSIRPVKTKISGHTFGLETFIGSNPDGSLGEYFNRIRYAMKFRNTATIRFRVDPQIVNLIYFTDLPSIKPLPAGKYAFTQYNIQLNSDSRRKVVFEGSYRGGGFYNGTIQQYVAGLRFRQQPWGNFTLNFEQNNLNFPAEYGKTVLKLISPKTEINFSNSMFWTTFIQYNTQRNNLNINSRFQWRYSPMSDFYLVYTDNYFVDPTLKNRSRALIFKLNYWLTV